MKLLTILLLITLTLTLRLTRTKLQLNEVTKELQNTRFKPISLLGAGAFGATLLAEDTKNDKKIVLKRQEVCGEDFDDHLREIEVLKEVRGMAGNVLPPEELFMIGNHFYYTMKPAVIDLNSIRSISKAKNIQLMSESHFINVLVDVLLGLAQLHKKDLIHKDIKMRNVVLRHDGSAVLIDFGTTEFTDIKELMPKEAKSVLKKLKLVLGNQEVNQNVQDCFEENLSAAEMAVCVNNYKPESEITKELDEFLKSGGFEGHNEIKIDAWHCRKQLTEEQKKELEKACMS